MCLSKCFLVVLCMSTLVVSQARDDVLLHCSRACEGAAYPTDSSLNKELLKVTHAQCSRDFRSGSLQGKACVKAFQGVALDSCTMGCRKEISGVQVKNTPEMSVHRSQCSDHTNNPNQKMACMNGISAGAGHFSTIGRQLRAEVDKLCADTLDDNKQAEPEVIPETVAVPEEVNTPRNTMQEEQVSQPEAEPEEVTAPRETEALEVGSSGDSMEADEEPKEREFSRALRNSEIIPLMEF